MEIERIFDGKKCIAIIHEKRGKWYLTLNDKKCVSNAKFKTCSNGIVREPAKNYSVAKSWGTKEEAIKFLNEVKENLMKTYSQEVKDYARAIHRLTCNANHTDQCGWIYGEEQREWNYIKTEKILLQLKEIITVKQLNALADLLQPTTKDW